MIKLNKYPGNPILSPDPGHAWESLVATNPGAVRDPATGKIILLYRCAGDDRQHIVRFGLGESEDGIHFERSEANPVFEPCREGHFDAGCVEDPRITPFGDEFLVKGCYDMGGVIFPCGKVVRDDTLYVYYGAADKYIGLATCSFSRLLDDLSRQPVEG